MIAVALRKPFAFLKKDVIVESSYKLAFIAQVFGIFISVVTFFFLGKLFDGSSVSTYLKPYGGDYFSFVLIGIAFSDLFMTAINIFDNHVREGQVHGTLEPLLMTKTSLLTIILSSSVYGFLLSFLRAVLYLFIGAVFFGAHYNLSGIFATMGVLLISLVNFCAIGLISASITLVIKKGNPVNWFFGSVFELLGGVLYPVAVLPLSLQIIAKFIPITYSLNAVRAVMIQGKPLNLILGDIGMLIIMGLVLSLLAYLSFNIAIKKVKTDGTLTHF